MSCNLGSVVAACIPGPQGPQGPGAAISIIGNVAGAPALVSTGTLFLSGGSNITLGQSGQSIAINGGAGITGTYAGTGVSSATQAGSTLGATLSTNGLSLAIPNWITTAPIGGVDVSIGGNTSGAPALISSGTLVLAGGNNVTLIQNGNSITISANTVAAANLSVSAGSTSGAFGGLTFSNTNNVTFGLNNGTMTASVVPQTTQTQPAGNIAGVGTTFGGTNISASITLNTNGLNLALSGAAGGSGASTGGIYVAGNTTAQSSSSTYAQSSLNVSLAGILSGGWSSNTLVISAPGTTGLTQLSAGVSTGGNTAGNTGLASAQLVLAGGNNITISGSTNGGSATYSIIGGAAGGGGVGFGVSTAGNTAGSTGTVTTGNVVLVGSGPISLSQSTGAAGSAATITINGPATSSISGTGLISVAVNGSTISIGANTLAAYAVSQTTQSSSGTVNGTALSFGGYGGVSIGVSNGSVLISGGAGGGASTAGLYALGNTTQNSSTTLNLSALSFAGLGEMTIGYSNGSIQISAPPSSLGVSNVGNTSGNTGTYSGQMILAGGNNITLSVSSAAGGAQTITFSGAAQITTGGFYATGNTTQNSSTTLALSSIRFNGLGAMTVGYSNSSIQLSAPSVSSISGTGAVSISTNGTVISIGVPGYTASYLNPTEQWQITNGQLGIGSIFVQPLSVPIPVQYDRIVAGIFYTQNGASTLTASLSGSIGLYSNNASTLSLIGSTSGSISINGSGATASSSYIGMRGWSMGSTTTLQPGQYYLAFASSTATAGANASLSNNIASQQTSNSYAGLLGQASNASNQITLGLGVFSASSASMPSSMAFSQLNGTNTSNLRPPSIYFTSGTA